GALLVGAVEGMEVAQQSVGIPQGEAAGAVLDQDGVQAPRREESRRTLSREQLAAPAAVVEEDVAPRGSQAGVIGEVPARAEWPIERDLAAVASGELQRQRSRILRIPGSTASEPQVRGLHDEFTGM